MALATNKLTLAWLNLIERASLSGGSYTAARPLANAQVRELQERSRTVDTTPASTQCLISLDRRRTIGALAIAAHNLSVDAKVRLRVRDNEDATLYDSDWLAAWRPILGLNQVEWEDDNWWSRQLDSEQRAEYTPLFWHFFEPVTSAHSVLLEIDDVDNEDGFVEFGRLVVANVWQPRINHSWGSAWGLEDATQVTANERRTAEFFDDGPRRRTFAAALDYLEAEEAFGELSRMQRLLGISGEVVITDQLVDTPQSHQRTMLARLIQLDPFTHPNADDWRTTLALREIL
jgi:hypothetical protein